ncbi:MAG: DEAD/DEAH box helicase [Zoogloeaceae bacterium]|jgi:superfamily II DNA/RNA helicase|nr:DEAD/DEAH box helicase [Zoogloeaceae bacterium]
MNRHHTPPEGEPAPPPAFATLGLVPELLKAIADAGYATPTPIQAEAIPLILAGQDIMGGAQTGTGKTAAFVLPILQRLLPYANASPSPARHPVRALVLTPTRELALQVFESVRTYAKHTPLRAMCAFGGVDVKPQIAELRRGVEILVATPGRLLDHIEQKSVHFHEVQALVLDEADRMLDMGFIPDIKRILNLLPEKRQSLLFSATFSDEIKRLADSILKMPILVEVARRNQVSDTVTHRVYPVSEGRKRALLIHLLQTGEIRQCIVFTRTKQECARLARELQRANFGVNAIHGDKSQGERLKALDGFKGGNIQVLVATDVAARGLDIEDLPYVINFELPHVPEDYVHRIGRTGRAGRHGQAISLMTPLEQRYLVEIEKLIKFRIEQIMLPGFEPECETPTPGRQPVRAPVASNSRGARPRQGRSNEKAEKAQKAVMIAADGFDFSKPYVPRLAVPDEAPLAENALVPASAPHSAPLKRPIRPVAALLGGLGKKTQ